MKSRFLYILLLVVLVLSAFVLALTFLNGISLSRNTLDFNQPGLDYVYDEDSSTGIKVLARRAISIPFGIDDVLNLSADGKSIDVSGHGECPEGAETYKLNITVNQDSTSAPAKGKTEGNCPSGSSINWSTEALAPGPITFEEGSTFVCGKAVIHFEEEGALTFSWCKEVRLK